MKFFLSLVQPADSRPGWETDPLSHPAFAAMDQRDLGDLPMVPALRERPVEGVVRVVCGEGSGGLGMATKAA